MLSERSPAGRRCYSDLHRWCVARHSRALHTPGPHWITPLPRAMAEVGQRPPPTGVRELLRMSRATPTGCLEIPNFDTRRRSPADHHHRRRHRRHRWYRQITAPPGQPEWTTPPTGPHFNAETSYDQPPIHETATVEGYFILDTGIVVDQLDHRTVVYRHEPRNCGDHPSGARSARSRRIYSRRSAVLDRNLSRKTKARWSAGVCGAGGART